MKKPPLTGEAVDEGNPSVTARCAAPAPLLGELYIM